MQAEAVTTIRTPMSNESVSAEHETIEIREKRKPLFCTKFGQTRFLCQRSATAFYFPNVLHVGPNMGCMLITYSIVVAPTLIFIFATGLASWVSVLLVVSIALTFLSFSIVACSDPGVVREHYVNASGEPAGILCGTRNSMDVRRAIGGVL
ncbi:hypothetical protein, variant [Aphanomyces invadans]|uniref:Uncharacterized protein n=1 Tax=Aphanomyces invadans TaxID=157072 RepID=A0A024TTM1_9STRA|nr:hypothetical protein, variant [Aphanomyces invadans]ETV96677.1 hypothetical protein, variant [Aphanomyces invadans]|eukprot:XP_008874940.1 hypothetical protein, variant [Aphanomyces invadans]